MPPRFAGRLENALKPIYPSQFAACREFLRHKEVLVSPRVLKNNGVPFITTRQQRGEYVVLWPTAYHQGRSSNNISNRLPSIALACAVSFSQPELSA